MATLDKEFKYYLERQKEFVEKYNNKFVVIHDNNLFGVFTSQEEAYKEASSKLPSGSFLIQQVTPGSEGYTISYHSRVRFS